MLLFIKYDNKSEFVIYLDLVIKCRSVIMVIVLETIQVACRKMSRMVLF